MKGWKDVATEDVRHRMCSWSASNCPIKIARGSSRSPFNATLRPSFFTISRPRPTTPFYQRRRRLTRRWPDRIYFDVARADRSSALDTERWGSAPPPNAFIATKVRCNGRQHAN